MKLSRNEAKEWEKKGRHTEANEKLMAEWQYKTIGNAWSSQIWGLEIDPLY